MAGARINTLLYKLYKRGTQSQSIFRLRFTPLGWVWVVGCAIIGLLGLDTTQTSAYQLFSLLAVAILAELLSVFFIKAPLNFRREISPTANAGSPISYRLTLINNSKRPLSAIKLVDNLPPKVPHCASFLHEIEPDELKRNAFDRFFLAYRWRWLISRHQIVSAEPGAAITIAARGQRAIQQKLTGCRRGVTQLDKLRVLIPGPLGLLYFNRTLSPDDGPSPLTVLPKRYRVPQLSLAGKQQYQPRGVSLAAPIGQSEEFIGLREYRPGDQLKHVHWKSWAKTGSPMVMEYADEFISRYALIVDSFTPPNSERPFEETVSLAASFACSLDTQESLLDMLFVEQEAHCITSGRGTTQPEYFLEVLASLTPCHHQPFAILQNLVNAHLREIGAAVVLLSDWDEERKTLLQSMRASRVDVTALLVADEGRHNSAELHANRVHRIDPHNVATEIHTIL